MKTVFEIFMYPISPQVHTLPGSDVQVTGTVKIQIPLFPSSMCVRRTSTSAEQLHSLAKNSQNMSIRAEEQSQATRLWGPQSLSSSHPFSAFQGRRDCVQYATNATPLLSTGPGKPARHSTYIVWMKRLKFGMLPSPSSVLHCLLTTYTVN